MRQSLGGISPGGLAASAICLRRPGFSGCIFDCGQQLNHLPRPASIPFLEFDSGGFWYY